MGYGGEAPPYRPEGPWQPEALDRPESGRFDGFLVLPGTIQGRIFLVLCSTGEPALLRRGAEPPGVRGAAAQPPNETEWR